MPDPNKLVPEADREFLEEKGYTYDVTQTGPEVRVTIQEFPLPTPYTPRAVQLMLKLPAGYPNANPDMFWTRPDVRLAANGAFPQAADVHEDGWQRWSRHSTWRPAIDNLRTKVASVVAELKKGR